MPGTIALDLLLARSDEIAVALGGMHVYTTGIAFELQVRQRRSARAADSASPMRLHEQVTGRHGSAGTDALLLGFGYPDGRTATNVGWGGRRPWEATDDSPVLHPGGGGGGDQSYDGTFWLSPLPTGGDLTVVCAWPAKGLAETRAVVAQRLIDEALTRVVELWPWSDDEESPAPQRPRLPEMPNDSWFTAALGDAPAADEAGGGPAQQQ